jgi:hypothetical protein
MMDTQRNAALDAAKGISLLSLPLIHSALVYARPEAQATRTGKVLAFIAEKLGANVFLTAMGFSIALGKEKQPGVLVKRTVKLFAQAYLLNMLKFVLPGITGHTHGFNAPDLGMGPYRNAIILNTILGYEYFPLEKDVPFQIL